MSRDIPLINRYLFVGAIIGVFVWQWFLPLRRTAQPVLTRWFSNAGLFLISRAACLTLLTASSLAMAIAAQSNPYGLLNRPFLPYGVTVVAGVLCFDFILYARHYLYHRWRPLWRFHKIHHSDLDFDMTTGLRFHPVEDFLSISTNLVVIAVLAPPPLAIAIAEGAVIVVNLVIHANAEYPRWLENVLRLVMTTPDLHSVHHSEDGRDFNSNFGVLFSVWDRLFGTFSPEAAVGRNRMRFGVRDTSGVQAGSLGYLLTWPFRK